VEAFNTFAKRNTVWNVLKISNLNMRFKKCIGHIICI